MSHCLAGAGLVIAYTTCYDLVQIEL